mmetsp:Transcript_8467/g.28308  ORF Transcript_8467/g.28308 Transcript_8467/m.28308 type:complete len:303 (+) Transcript_8467:1047-1955(+)
MANPFSLNGPALHWSHRIVRGSRCGSVHFFRLFLDPSSPSSPWFVLATIRSIARALDFAKSAAAATLSVTALGTTPSSPRALPFANAHHREMCMRMPFVLNGPPRQASQYKTFSPCSRSSWAARSGDSMAPRHASPTRPGATFTNAGSPEQHAFTVFEGWFTLSQSFNPRCCVRFTISLSNSPVGPASLRTWKQIPLMVPTPIRFSTSCKVSSLLGRGTDGGFFCFFFLASAPASASFCFFFFWDEEASFSVSAIVVPDFRGGIPPPPVAVPQAPGASTHVTNPSSRFVAVTPVRPPGPFSH